MRAFLSTILGFLAVGAANAQTPQVHVEFGGDPNHQYKEGQLAPFLVIRSHERLHEADLTVNIRVSESGNMLRDGRSQNKTVYFPHGGDLAIVDLPTIDDTNEESNVSVRRDRPCGGSVLSGSLW